MKIILFSTSKFTVGDSVLEDSDMPVEAGLLPGHGSDFGQTYFLPPPSVTHLVAIVETTFARCNFVALNTELRLLLEPRLIIFSTTMIKNSPDSSSSHAVPSGKNHQPMRTVAGTIAPL